jgi:hypothetical protein
MIAQTFVVETAEIEEQLEIHIENARDIFRALNVARHPVKRVGNAA